MINNWSPPGHHRTPSVGVRLRTMIGGSHPFHPYRSILVSRGGQVNWTLVKLNKIYRPKPLEAWFFENQTLALEPFRNFALRRTSERFTKSFGSPPVGNETFLSLFQIKFSHLDSGKRIKWSVPIGVLAYQAHLHYRYLKCWNWKGWVNPSTVQLVLNFLDNYFKGIVEFNRSLLMLKKHKHHLTMSFLELFVWESHTTFFLRS